MLSWYPDMIEFLRGAKRFYWTFCFYIDEYQAEFYVIDDFGNLCEVNEQIMYYSLKGANH